ncbi:P-loop containing nucleoside triphosphate hydrolase protein [Syncephalis fuscata]|nr:P-loop containing nucleoside triphosphate hydrolase protein [Syncephalis fuscata]
MVQSHTVKHSGVATTNGIYIDDSSTTDSDHGKAVRILETPPRRRQQQTKLFQWIKSPSIDSNSEHHHRSTTDIKSPTPTKRTILGQHTNLSNYCKLTGDHSELVSDDISDHTKEPITLSSSMSPLSTNKNGHGSIKQSTSHIMDPLSINDDLYSEEPSELLPLNPVRRRVKRIIDSPEPESFIANDDGIEEKEEEEEEGEEEEILQQSYKNNENLLNRKRSSIESEPMDVDQDPLMIFNDDIQTANRKRRLVTRADSIKPIEMDIQAPLVDINTPTIDLTAMDMDEQSESTVEFFSNASQQELQDALRISDKQAVTIIEQRPFTDIDHLYTLLGKARGVSAQLINRYEEMIEGYEAVDKLIKHCQNESKRVVPPTISEEITGFKLKGYQVAGMGLGKTAQVIAFLSELRHSLNEEGPHLIIVPSSTLDNWLREFEKFCPSLRVISYYGSQTERRELREDILSLRHTDTDYHAVISTYSVATSDKHDRIFMRKMHFKTMILDEGHMVKNFTSDRYVKLMSINVSFRLLLTGTPLQNNLQELLSLLTFVMPLNKEHDVATMRCVFRPVSVAEIDGQGNRRAAKFALFMLDPFILRRRKAQVLKDLPKKIRYQITCSMTPFQRRVYAQIDKRSRDQCQQETENQSAQSSAVIQLRKASCHPLLFRTLYTDKMLHKMATNLLKEPDYYDSEHQYLVEDMQVMSDSELHNLCKKFKHINSYRLKNNEWMDAGKVKELCDIIDKAKEKNDRVLVFSQFTMVLDVLELVMETRNENYLRLDGNTKVDTRQDMLDTFATDTSISVFLLSTKAGGFGLNITAANVVILYDPDFNPHNDRQAEDRAHRVGQTKDVTIYKLISQGSIEEYMIQCAKLKLKLDKSLRGRSGSAVSGDKAVSDNSDDSDSDADDDNQRKINDALRMTTLRQAWLASQLIEE